MPERERARTAMAASLIELLLRSRDVMQHRSLACHGLPPNSTQRSVSVTGCRPTLRRNIQ